MQTEEKGLSRALKELKTAYLKNTVSPW